MTAPVARLVADDAAGRAAAVQVAARYVAPPVGEEGAAQMIERIALDGWRAPASGAAAGPDAEARNGVQVERR